MVDTAGCCCKGEHAFQDYYLPVLAHFHLSMFCYVLHTMQGHEVEPLAG